jgi:hypothetical protein
MKRFLGFSAVFKQLKGTIKLAFFWGGSFFGFWANTVPVSVGGCPAIPTLGRCGGRGLAKGLPMASWALLGGRWTPQITPDPGPPIIFGASGIWDFRLPVLGNEIPPLVLGGAWGRHWPPKCRHEAGARRPWQSGSGLSRARGAGFRFWGAGFRIQTSGLRQTSGFSAGRCCGGEAGSSCAVLHVFEMRSQRRLNGGSTRPVLRVWARWVLDLGGFQFCCTHTSGFSATGCCGGKAVPSSAMRHIFWKPEAGPLRTFAAGAVGVSARVRVPLHSQTT